MKSYEYLFSIKIIGQIRDTIKISRLKLKVKTLF